MPTSAFTNKHKPNFTGAHTAIALFGDVCVCMMVYVEHVHTCVRT